MREIVFEMGGLTPFWAWHKYLPLSSARASLILRDPVLGVLMRHPSPTTAEESSAPAPSVGEMRRCEERVRLVTLKFLFFGIIFDLGFSSGRHLLSKSRSLYRCCLWEEYLLFFWIFFFVCSESWQRHFVRRAQEFSTSSEGKARRRGKCVNFHTTQNLLFLVNFGTLLTTASIE